MGITLVLMVSVSNSGPYYPYRRVLAMLTQTGLTRPKGVTWSP